MVIHILAAQKKYKYINMNYSKIYDPQNKEYVKLKSDRGKEVLKIYRNKYIFNLEGGAASPPQFVMGTAAQFDTSPPAGGGGSWVNVNILNINSDGTYDITRHDGMGTYEMVHGSHLRPTRGAAAAATGTTGATAAAAPEGCRCCFTPLCGDYFEKFGRAGGGGGSRGSGGGGGGASASAEYQECIYCNGKYSSILTPDGELPEISTMVHSKYGSSSVKLCRRVPVSEECEMFMPSQVSPKEARSLKSEMKKKSIGHLNTFRKSAADEQGELSISLRPELGSSPGLYTRISERWGGLITPHSTPDAAEIELDLQKIHLRECQERYITNEDKLLKEVLSNIVDKFDDEELSSRLSEIVKKKGGNEKRSIH